MPYPSIEPMLKFSISLPSSIHERADEASQNCLPNLAKVERVYRNVLASYVVQYYLRLNDYAVFSQEEKSSHPIDALLSDQPGLRLPGYGVVSTASLLKGQQKFEMPLMLAAEPVACLAVEFDDEWAEASILGFVTSTAAGTTIALEQLESFEEFPAYLTSLNPLASTVTQLQSWWERSFETGWTLISELATPEAASDSATWAVRSARMRGIAPQRPQERSSEVTPATPEDGVICRRSIEFSDDDEPLSLLFGIERFPQGSGENEKIFVTLNPAMAQGALPADIQIEAFDESGACFAAARSRSVSPSLSIRFRAEKNDYFMIQITHRGITIRDAYIV